MNAFKDRCIVLRKKDYTLSEIVKVTGRPKTSVYFHIKNLPLSLEKQKAIRDARCVRALQIAKSRRGKSARSFRKFSQWSEHSVLLVAHLIFDGEINRRGCIYNNRNVSLLKRVEICMKDMYDFAPARYHNRLTGVARISYFNVALGSYVKVKAEELLSGIIKMPKSFKREFLRAFFDDEGCVDFRPERSLRRIRGYQKNVMILDIIQELLASFDIVASIQLPNEVVVTGRENLLRFQKEINFSPGVKINGSRSNSLWRKHLQKRTILQNAISSFRGAPYYNGKSIAKAPAPRTKKERQTSARRK